MTPREMALTCLGLGLVALLFGAVLGNMAPVFWHGSHTLSLSQLLGACLMVGYMVGVAIGASLAMITLRLEPVEDGADA
jgi:hypothetical protein